MSTELEIINAMLASVGSNGVTSTVGRHPGLIKAQPILNRINKTVQNRGHWFNTDIGLKLTPNQDSEFVVPQNTLKADCTTKSLPYVRRGRRMYDPENQTYKLDETELLIDVVIELDYEFLPHAAWDYIRAKAVLSMLANSEADQLSMQAANNDVKETKLDFERERRNQADTNLRDNPEYAFIMHRMPRMHSSSRNAQRIGG